MKLTQFTRGFVKLVAEDSPDKEFLIQTVSQEKFPKGPLTVQTDGAVVEANSPNKYHVVIPVSVK